MLIPKCVFACLLSFASLFMLLKWISSIGTRMHTAPERCQPEKFATPSFSAFLVVCDQDKKLQVGQQIL